ncbi:hypothetical protein Q9L58_010078 [Maublancomyces gigas]|uniref:Uncharacterized protein n=1 Tax=Discina gigas TaxID=1032678 RepID=A0ABR3G570_9PEZI
MSFFKTAALALLLSIGLVSAAPAMGRPRGTTPILPAAESITMADPTFAKQLIAAWAQGHRECYMEGYQRAIDDLIHNAYLCRHCVSSTLKGKKATPIAALSTLEVKEATPVTTPTVLVRRMGPA